jgi:hypothetical protein
MDHVLREPRYLATKLAMLRQAVVDGWIRLVKVVTKLSPSDIFTKPLVGVALLQCRALVLGRGLGEVATAAALVADDGEAAWAARLAVKRKSVKRAAAARR